MGNSTSITQCRSTAFLSVQALRLKPLVFDQQLIKFRLLRALNLSNLFIQEVPDRIGELIHLRFLNLSNNNFKCLPGSFTKLLNLITLDISSCSRLEALPNDFGKLINLRHLIADDFVYLKHMPRGLGQMTSMQRLNYFIVDDATGIGKGNGPDALAQMKLRGCLRIQFSKEVDGWVEDALVLGLSRLSASIEELVLSDYPGKRILSLPTNLVELQLIGCEKVIHLPPFQCFPYLQTLELRRLDELEYVGGDGCNSAGGGQGSITAAGSNASCLKRLVLGFLPKLKGWSREGVEEDQPLTLRLGEALTSLEYLKIRECGTFKKLCFPAANVLEELYIEDCKGLEFGDEEEKRAVDWVSLHKLRRLTLWALPGLESFKEQALTSLERLEISECSQLKSVFFPSGHLCRLHLSGCPALELRAEDKWVSLPGLRELHLKSMEKLERLPGEDLTSLTALDIRQCCSLKRVYLPSADSNMLKKLTIEKCPVLLMGKNPMVLDWVSLRDLKLLRLCELPELESFSAEALTSLRTLSIKECRRLKKLCLLSKNRSVLDGLRLERCQELELWEEDEKRGMDWGFLSTLTRLSLVELPQLEGFQGEALTSLRSLSLSQCNQLKSVKLPPPHLNMIEELEITFCRDLELWKKKRGVDWDSLPNLRALDICGMPKPKRLPHCLRQRQDLLKLRVAYDSVGFFFWRLEDIDYQ